jgi:hypothetical protein
MTSLTTKELLYAAAKAVGYSPEVYITNSTYLYAMDADNNAWKFDPLQDDATAFWLASKLNFTVSFFKDNTIVSLGNTVLANITPREGVREAERYAITYAAAMVGNTL